MGLVPIVRCSGETQDSQAAADVRQAARRRPYEQQIRRSAFIAYADSDIFPILYFWNH